MVVYTQNEGLLPYVRKLDALFHKKLHNLTDLKQKHFPEHRSVLFLCFCGADLSPGCLINVIKAEFATICVIGFNKEVCLEN